MGSQIALQQGVPEGGIMRVTLRDRDEAVLFEGELRWRDAHTPEAVAPRPFLASSGAMCPPEAHATK